MNQQLFKIFNRMKWGIACALLVASCGTPGNNLLTLINPMQEARPDELVVVKRSDLQQQLGNIASGQYVLVSTAGNKPVVVQYDDLDKDGNWDELAFLYSFAGDETASLTLSIANAPAAVKAIVLAHVRHKRKNADNTFGDDLLKDSIPAGQPATDFTKQALPPFLTEGPAWENDKVGFRIYFDVRNGKDIWGKTTTRMVMDEVGVDTAKNYHQQATWGMDILKVGASLGAGSLAVYVPGANNKDSLVRLGGKNIAQTTYEKIADGPVRAILRLQYKGWKVSDALPPVDLTEQISIWGGQYCYESKVTVTNAPANARLATGIVNLHSRHSLQFDVKGCHILYTHDEQSENKDNLGMAIVIKDNYAITFGETPNVATDVQNTYTIVTPISNNQPVSYRFYAGWEKSNPRFASVQGFKKYLQIEALKYANPLIRK
jgi:hypothetical protein